MEQTQNQISWKKPIFIVGQSNSGTKCLFFSFLYGHPDLGGFNLELHNFGIPPLQKAQTGRLFALSPQIESYHITSIKRPTEKGTGPIKPTVVKQHLANYAKNNLISKDNPDKKKGLHFYAGKRSLFKDPRLSMRIRWLKEIFPDAYIISIIRHPFAVIEGIRRRHHGNASIEDATRQYNSCYSIIEEDSKYINNFKMVRYEDMIENPIYPNENDMFWKPLLEFLELDSGKLQVPSKTGYTHIGKGKNLKSEQLLTENEKKFIKDKASYWFKKYSYDK